MTISRQVESYARAAGLDFLTVRSQVELLEFYRGSIAGTHPDGGEQPNNYLSGSDGMLVDWLSRKQPALVIFDLDGRDIPWKDWLPVIAASPATRRIPVICIAGDGNGAEQNGAARLGATAVYPRATFVAQMSEQIQRHAIRVNDSEIVGACRLPLSPIAERGLQLFNQGHFFEAHEYLEIAWKEDTTPGRELYRAILQIGIAYMQIQRNNFNGAIKMFLRVRQWITPLPDTCRGVNVSALKVSYQRAYDALVALGPERITEFDARLFSPVIYNAG